MCIYLCLVYIRIGLLHHSNGFPFPNKNHRKALDKKYADLLPNTLEMIYLDSLQGGASPGILYWYLVS